MSTTRIWFGFGFGLAGAFGIGVVACSSDGTTSNTTTPNIDARTLADTGTLDGTAADTGAPGASDAGRADGAMPAVRNYKGAGSEYTVTVDPVAKTILITHSPSIGAAPDSTINTTYVTYPSGFLELTVTSATGTNPPATGSLAIGLEIPDSVFFLKPISGPSNHVIPMIPAGTCPATVLAENWVDMKVNSFWNESKRVSGTFHYDAVTGAAQIVTSFALGALTTDLGPQVLGSSPCANGAFALDAGNGDFFLTAAGGAIVHINPLLEADGGDQIIFALPQAAAAVPLASLAGRYSGLVFAGGSNSNLPVELTLAASGNGVAGSAVVLSDVATETRGDGGALLVLSSVGATNGVVNGTIETGNTDGGGSAEPMTCVVQLGAGANAQTVLTCASVDKALNFFSVALASRP